MAELIMQEEGSTPSTPASTKWKIYPKGTGWYYIDDGGIENRILSDDHLFYKFSVTVASNDLIVTIQHPDGTNPSAQRPLWLHIGDTWRSIVTTTTITLADGTRWFNSGSAELGTKLVGYFVYAVWDSNSSVVALSIARVPYGRLVSDFITTNTDEKHLYNFANFTSTDPVANIGYFEATLSLSGTSHLWTVPTFTNANLKNEPTFETPWLTWTPVHARSGGAYTNLPTQNLAKYLVRGRTVFFEEQHTQHATPGSSGYQTVTIPFLATNNNSGTGFQLNSAYALAIFIAATTLAGLRLFKYDGTGEATASAAYGAWGNYEI